MPVVAPRVDEAPYGVPVQRISERDVRLALDVVAAAGGTQNGAPFSIEAVDTLAEAVRADEAAYFEWRFGDQACLRVSRAAQPAWLDEALSAACASYPLRDVDHASSADPRRITDVVSARAFRATRFYRDVMRPCGLEHELKLWLPAPPGHAYAFDLLRASSPDFSERDGKLLSLLRPQLAKLRARWERRPRLPSLTNRELDVLSLVAQGLTNRQVAHRLFISPATVRTHLENVYDKLGVRSRAAAVSAAAAAS